jgi:predicted nucleic acid-binding protein
MGPRRPVGAAYLDTSAAVKLLRDEPESESLERFLGDWTRRISCEVLRVGLVCVCHRQGIASSAADELLSNIRLLPLTSVIVRGACQPFDPPQRALDALHLATAARARGQLGCFISYDGAQLAAAAALGWRTEAPAGRD